MSHQAVSSVLKLKVGHPIAKAILLYLAERHNPNNGCFPSQSDIAEDMELSEASVRRYVGMLTTGGFIERRFLYHKGKIARTYYDFDGVPQIPIPQTVPVPQTPITRPTDTTYIKEVLNRKLTVSKSPNGDSVVPKKSRKPAADPRNEHPAILSIFTVTGRKPNKDVWDTLIDKLGDEVDISRLTECFTTWRLKGWSPQNFAWALEWYVDGIPDKFKTGKAPPSFQNFQNVQMTDFTKHPVRVVPVIEIDDVPRFTPEVYH